MVYEGDLFQSMDAEDGPSDTGDGQILAPVDRPPAERVRPTPHRSKLEELLKNSKLPPVDRPRVTEAIARYDVWIHEMASLRDKGEAKVVELTRLLNEYKSFVELDLIWDSPEDFLYRQRGQTKLDNSIIEEFLPWLVDPDILPELQAVDCHAGPAKAFAAVYFSSILNGVSPLAGLQARTKDQDFTLSKRAFIRASFDERFNPSRTETKSVWLAYLAAEVKTNLDKTMFQEASATSHDLKVALPGARYYVICEFLDMTPISTAGTDIDEALILRGKRLPSNKRKEYGSAGNRARRRQEYESFIGSNPIRSDVMLRFVEHLDSLLTHADPDEDDAVQRGFF
ncbi:Bpu10I family restriction endonuclease [Micromonospora wenchangensis]|uniref:Bpu10I family restriction endonuclease n=1 Tax=Micromonospora wenchangensis TaxID=1185415 RepID=UPI0038210E07